MSFVKILLLLAILVATTIALPSGGEESRQGIQQKCSGCWIRKVRTDLGNTISRIRNDLGALLNFRKIPTSENARRPVSETVTRFPAEWEKHELCFMQWPTNEKIWMEQLNDVRKDVVAIALAIAQYEPVTLIVSPQDVEEAKQFFNATCNINIVTMPCDSVWARDTFPTFIKTAGRLSAVNFNFNAWGNKETHESDKLITSRIVKYLQMQYIDSGLVAEGGALETDGDGTLLITESSIVNDNRNPNKSRDEIDAALRKALGVDKIIWFKGFVGGDITDAHVDVFVRFSSPGNVVVMKPHSRPDWLQVVENIMKTLQNETDAKGRKFTIVELPNPYPEKIPGKGKYLCSSYLNYYVANDAVIVPKFNHKEADDKAVEILRGLFPGRKVEQVQIDTIAIGDGGIHCVTHELPKV